MKQLFSLIFSKLLAALPTVVESNEAFYRQQIIILQRTLLSKGVKRILATPEEIRQLLAIGKQLDHQIDGKLLIVTPATYRNWLTRRKQGNEMKRPGRKRSIPKKIIDAVLRLARENKGWGVLRIAGELRKLGVQIAASTIQRIFKDNDQPIPPRYSKTLPISNWANFVKCNMENIVSTDFFSKSIYTLKGKFQAYSMVFIHYATRRVYLSPPTFNPDEAWVMQQARNFAMWLEDEKITLRFMIHDSDTKYTARFSDFFTQIIKQNHIEGHSEGKVIKTAIRCPPQNGYAETWIGHCKAECLNWFACFSLQGFGRIITKYLYHYNHCRPHQNKDNKVLDQDFSYPEDFDPAKLRCRTSLGGLLKHYYLADENEAAA